MEKDFNKLIEEAKALVIDDSMISGIEIYDEDKCICWLNCSYYSSQSNNNYFHFSNIEEFKIGLKSIGKR